MAYPISVGIITYNSPLSEISRCLRAINNQDYGAENIEIIIRNHGHYVRQEEIRKLVYRHNWSNIKIYQGDNIGFGSGHNNIFTQISNRSKAYLCLNPDGLLHINALSELVSMTEKYNWKGIFEAIQEPIMHPKKFDPESGLTAWCSGACVLIPVTLYQAINGFDSDFFLYCEDVDLSWRVKAAGYHCYTCRKALFFHYAMNRQDRELEIWKSATYLAHKWHANQFKNLALTEWSNRVDISKKELLNTINQIQQHRLENVMKANPDFKHGLHFSEPMWK